MARGGRGADAGERPAGDPHVFTFDFTAPTGLHDVGLFAVVTCAEDPIAETRTDVQASRPPTSEPRCAAST
jgi:hypothetical protein